MRRKLKRGNAWALPIVTLGMIVASGHALAQVENTENPRPEKADETRTFEIITITAEKRESTIQSTPIAVSALSANQIQDQGINNLEQLQYLVPSLTYSQNSGFTLANIRGIGANLIGLASDPAIGTYTDGIYTGSNITQQLGLFDLERIEVLRGPQGTLYGRNTTGGVINYITKKPEFDRSANISAVAGSYGRQGVDFSFTTPLVTDLLAFRASGHVEEHDGYRKNLELGIKEDKNTVTSGRASLLWTPSANFEAILSVDHTRNKNTNPFVLISTQGVTPQTLTPDPFTTAQTPLGLFSQPAAVLASIPNLLSPADLAALNGGSIAEYFGRTQAGVPPTNPEETTDFSNGWPTRFLTTTDGIGATLEWKLSPSVSLKSITAYREDSLAEAVNTSGTSVLGPLLLPLRQDSEQFTQELNLIGESFDGKLQWVLGGFYLKQKAQQASTVYIPNFGDSIILGASLASSGPYALDLSQPLLPLFQLISIPEATVTIDGPGLDGTPAIAGLTIPAAPFVGFNHRQDSQSYAGFAQGTYELQDDLRFTAGLRYTVDDKDVIRSFHSNLIPFFNAALGQPLDTGVCDDVRDGKSWYALTGNATLDYDATANTLVYGRYARGYKSGGFNAGECTGGFDPEVLDSYEIGLKLASSDGRYLMNTAVFYYDYSDIQFLTFVNNTATVANAGAAKVAGAEVEFVGHPEATPGLQVEASVAYNHSAYAEGIFSDVSNLYTADIDGNRLNRAPEWRVNLGSQYEFSIADFGQLTVRGEATWTDKMYNDILNGTAPYQSGTTQPAYWLVNARIMWSDPEEHYQVQVFGENLTDELYATNRTAYNTPANFISVGGQFAAPRTFGVRLIASF